MQHTDTTFDPVFHFRFTREEVGLMIECSQKHYDAVCKTASECGGFLYGINNKLDFGPNDCSLKWRELDILCKILEVGNYLDTMEKRGATFVLSLGLRRVLRDYPGAQLKT